MVLWGIKISGGNGNDAHGLGNEPRNMPIPRTILDHVGDHKIIWYLYTLVLYEYKVRSIGDRIWQANRVKRREHHRPAFFISFGLFRKKVML